MNAAPRPTFTGFVATTIDAAYLVEAAAVARTLPRLVGCNGDARTLVRSGAVLVHGDEYKRWKDGRKWSDGRNLKNGFNIYRELATDPADCMTREELQDEEQKRGELYAFLDAHVGREGSKRGGLVKKAIKLEIGGQQWGLVAYYTLADALTGNLVRPRSSPLGAQLVAWGLSPDFFAQPRKAARTAVMADDDGTSSVADWKLWYKARRVVRGQYLQSDAAPGPQHRQQHQHQHQHQQPGQTAAAATAVREISPDSGVDVDSSPAAGAVASGPASSDTTSSDTTPSSPTAAAAAAFAPKLSPLPAAPPFPAPFPAPAPASPVLSSRAVVAPAVCDRQQQRQRQGRQREQEFRGHPLNGRAAAREAAARAAVLCGAVRSDVFLGAEEAPREGSTEKWWDWCCE